MWDDYHVFLIITLVFTRLLFNETYHLIELSFDWLIDWLIDWRCNAFLLDDLILGFCYCNLTRETGEFEFAFFLTEFKLGCLLGIRKKFVCFVGYLLRIREKSMTIPNPWEIFEKRANFGSILVNPGELIIKVFYKKDFLKNLVFPMIFAKLSVQLFHRTPSGDYLCISLRTPYASLKLVKW